MRCKEKKEEMIFGVSFFRSSAVAATPQHSSEI